jgi:hypothetical protein
LWGFIQSRPYASVADIRRLFTMDVDCAAVVPTVEGTYFIGLPQEAADLVGQLWREGRIVLDTNPDIRALVVQGVYPARAMFSRQPGPPPNQQNGKGRGAQGALAIRPAREASVAALDGAPGNRDEGTLDGSVAPDGGDESVDAVSARTGKRRRRRRRHSSKSGGGADAETTLASGAAAGEAMQPAIIG